MPKGSPITSHVRYFNLGETVSFKCDYMVSNSSVVRANYPKWVSRNWCHTCRLTHAKQDCGLNSIGYRHCIFQYWLTCSQAKACRGSIGKVKKYQTECWLVINCKLKAEVSRLSSDRLSHVWYQVAMVQWQHNRLPLCWSGFESQWPLFGWLFQLHLASSSVG